MGKEQKPKNTSSGAIPNAFDTPEVEKILAGLGTGSPGCLKSCIVNDCPVRDYPGSKEADAGCPKTTDDDGLPLTLIR